MCSFGRQPKTHKYMTKDPDALKTYMQKSIANRRKQAVARNLMDTSKQIDALQKQINDIRSGKADPTK